MGFFKSSRSAAVEPTTSTSSCQTTTPNKITNYKDALKHVPKLQTPRQRIKEEKARKKLAQKDFEKKKETHSKRIQELLAQRQIHQTVSYSNSAPVSQSYNQI
jgi:hypothetical protein